MTVQATYATDDIEIVYTAETETDDYGVPGSPTWETVKDSTIDVLHVTILGVDVNVMSLPKDLQDAIHSMCDGLDFE